MLKIRVLRVTLAMPGGNVVLNEELDLRVNIRKAALALQNRAQVIVFGMSKTLREQLLSQFTAWNKRQVDSGVKEQKWIDVKIEAGYRDHENKEVSAVVFKGQVVLVNLVGLPPDIGISITCFSRQIDKTSFVSDPAPVKTTLEEYVKWAAGQMGLADNYLCDTSYNKMVLTNPSSGAFTIAAILIDIQNARRPDIAAFIDDDFLVVKDRDRIINPSDIAKVKEFVGIPSWTEWGVEFTQLFDTNTKLAHAADLESILNPSVNGKYVIVSLNYDLTSRDVPFYVMAQGAPPAE